MFSDSALPVLNGVSVSVDQLVRGLRALGHSVSLFTSGYRSHVETDPNTVRFHSVLTPWAPGYPLSIPPFYGYLREFRRRHFDIVHCHTPFTVGMVGLRWAQSEETAVVATYHTQYDKYAHYVPFLPHRYTRFKIAKHTNYFYNHVTQVITPSEAAASWLRRHAVRTPIEVVPTGIRLPEPDMRAASRQRLDLGPADTVVLYTGRIAREKNLPVLIEAMKPILEQRPNVYLWIVGDGPQREELRTLARQTGMGDRIRFFGFIARDEIDRYYAAADVFAFTSMTETQGLVVVEAMSHGLPAVVVTGGGAGAAVRDGENGFLVSNRPHEVTEALLRLLEDRQLARVLSAGARETAEEYTVEKMVARVVAVYHLALGTERAASQPVAAE